MAATGRLYGLAMQSLFNAEIDYDTATVKALLTTSSYAPNQDTHRYKSSVTNEVAGTGYTAGGQALTGKTVTYDGNTNTLTLSCANPTWNTSTITARYIVFYVDTGTAATSALIAYVDFGQDVASTNGTFTYPVPSTGIAQFTTPA